MEEVRVPPQVTPLAHPDTAEHSDAGNAVHGVGVPPHAYSGVQVHPCAAHASTLAAPGQSVRGAQVHGPDAAACDDDVACDDDPACDDGASDVDNDAEWAPAEDELPSGGREELPAREEDGAAEAAAEEENRDDEAVTADDGATSLELEMGSDEAGEEPEERATAELPPEVTSEDAVEGLLELPATSRDDATPPLSPPAAGSERAHSPLAVSHTMPRSQSVVEEQYLFTWQPSDAANAARPSSRHQRWTLWAGVSMEVPLPRQARARNGSTTAVAVVPRAAGLRSPTCAA